MRTGIVNALRDARPEINHYRNPVVKWVPPCTSVQGFVVTELASGVYQTFVDIIVATPRTEKGIDEIDALVDPENTESVVSALDRGFTVGDRFFSTRLDTIGDYGDYENAGVAYIGAALRYEVL